MSPRTLHAAASLVAAILLVGAAPGGAASPGAGAGGGGGTRDPVIVVPGTLAGEPLVEVDIQSLADHLRAEGYAVFVYWLPGNGLGDMRETAAGLPAFVDDVLEGTGASSVDVVGHSQGGLLARWYVRFLGGDAVVDSLVTLGTPHHGTQLANLGSLFGLWNCLSVGVCTQAAVGSSFLAELNEGDATWGDVRYTSVTTRLDEIVVPYTNALLGGDGSDVVVQQQCPLRIVEHLAMPSDAAVQGGVVDALEGAPVTLACDALL